MKQQNSLGNIKNLQKQHRLFALIHLINSRAQGREIINICLITASMIGNILNFLSLKEINVLNTQLFVLDKIFNLVFLPILGVILLQLLVGFLYQVEFFVAIQWKAFRFLVYPFLMSYLLNESLTGQFLGQSAAVVLFVAVLVISLILTAIFSTQSYVYRKLLHRDLPINFHLLLIETLFLVCGVVENPNIKMTCGLLITLKAFNLYNNTFSVLKQNSVEYRILGVSSFLLLWSGLVYCIALFTLTSDMPSLLIASIPCLLYKIGSDLSRQLAPVTYRGFTSIFDDPDTINFQSFIQSVQPVIQQIMQYYQLQSKRDFFKTLLMSYYYEHSNRCLNVNCPFRNEDFRYQMKNMNDSKNLKDVLFRICKKIDFLYYGMYKSWPEHIDLKLSLVQFYIFCFPNKIRALEIISEIALSKLTLQQDYELFRVKILCQNMKNLQVSGEFKLDEKIVQFENLIYLTLNTMMQFWSLFYQQKVDFNKLTSITMKIFPLRQKIQEIFQSRLCQQTFSTLQILKLYSLYCGSIENNQLKAWKLNDYLQKLHSKLGQHKQIEYLSFESQIGLVAVSLSQSILGNIAMVNSQAGSIFGYSKKDFKTINVNDIMPRIFGTQHDNYLKVFLQHKTKKVNSDERQLLGKNKAGYIFPILLQLQRTVSSTGDQLLFIANIRKLKLHQSLIICCTDEQGQINDYSSTFHYLFFKQQKQKVNQKIQNKNIQQFIPDFFDPSIQQNENTHCKHFKQMANIKNYGQLQIEYLVKSVTFPLKKNGGFVIQGHIIYKQKPLVFPHLSITSSLREMIKQQTLTSHKFYYNEKLNRYQISKQHRRIRPIDQFNKPFTIPFINIHDVTQIMQIKKQGIIYGQNIKTIRLIGDHFERVQQGSQFMSELDMQRTQSAQTINQIMQMKQSLVKEKKPIFMRNVKIMLLIFTIACVSICGVLVDSYNNYVTVNMTYLDSNRFKFQTRGYLSQYITYFTAIQNGFNNSTYNLTMTINNLINSIENAQIDELQKEQMMKITYLQDKANLTMLMNSQTLVFNYDQSDAFSPIQLQWYIFFIIVAFLIIIAAISYFLFLGQLQSVYQVFMCLQQKIIKKLYLQCQKLAKILQNGSQKDKIIEKIHDQHKLSNDKSKSTQENQEDDQNPVKKIRKFKQNQRFRNLLLFIKLIFPFLVILSLAIISVVTLTAQNNNISSKIEIHKQILNIVPESSVFLMNTFLKNIQNYSSLVTHDFMTAYQSIDQTLFNYEETYPGQMSKDFFMILLNNVCKNGNFTDRQLELCDKIIGGTMTVGLSRAVNYFANVLMDLDKHPKNGQFIKNFNDIILLQYKFIFPLVEEMAQMMYNELNLETQSFYGKYSTFTIVIMILIGVNYCYFLKYPAYEIEQKLHLSKGLIDLLPEYYKKEKPNNKQGFEEDQQKDQLNQLNQ